MPNQRGYSIEREVAGERGSTEARRCFSEVELVNLTMAVVAINSWNRIQVAFRALPQLAASEAA